MQVSKTSKNSAVDYIFNIIHISSWDSDELSAVTVSLCL